MQPKTEILGIPSNGNVTVTQTFDAIAYQSMLQDKLNFLNKELAMITTEQTNLQAQINDVTSKMKTFTP